MMPPMASTYRTFKNSIAPPSRSIARTLPWPPQSVKRRPVARLLPLCDSRNLRGRGRGVGGTGTAQIGGGRIANTAGDMALRLDHPVYDCFYLALAAREDVLFVTADARLIDAVTGSP